MREVSFKFTQENPGNSVGKKSACNAGDPWFNSWIRKIPWKRNGLPISVFLGFPVGSDGKKSPRTLFTIARIWKQPRCPSGDKWIRKLWYMYTMEYYSAITKNGFESVLMRWMKLEPTIQSEVSQKEKHQYSILTHIYGI